MAGIPVTSALSSPAILEVLPPSAELPVMAVAILCVWATYCSVTQIYESAPEASLVHEPAPEASLVHESAAEPPEVAASAHELSACPVRAIEAVHELIVFPATAMEAVHELFARPVTAKGSIHELSACSVTAVEAVVNLSLLLLNIIKTMTNKVNLAVEAGAGAGATASEADPPWPPESPDPPWPPESPDTPWPPELPALPWVLERAPPWRPSARSLCPLRPPERPPPLPVGCCTARDALPGRGRKCQTCVLSCVLFCSPCAFLALVSPSMSLFGFSCSCPHLGWLLVH